MLHKYKHIIVIITTTIITFLLMIKNRNFIEDLNKAMESNTDEKKKINVGAWSQPILTAQLKQVKPVYGCEVIRCLMAFVREQNIFTRMFMDGGKIKEL